MLKRKSNYMTYPDGVGTSWRTLDRRLVEIRQQYVHFREESVGERRRWDAQVAGTVIERAVSVPGSSAVERGDVFVIEGQQYEVVDRQYKTFPGPEHWFLSLKKPVSVYREAAG